MAASYHQLGMLAQLQGDYAAAERQCQRSLAINEELGNRAGMAVGYHQLGMLAQDRRDYGEAERQYQRSLAIKEELGNRPGMATTWSGLGSLARAVDQPAEAIGWHLRALFQRLEVQLPEAAINIEALAALREELGGQEFTTQVVELVGSDEAAHDIDRLIDDFKKGSL